jgi:hypothetical protein
VIFDMVNHEILQQRLQTSLEISDVTSKWFYLYLYGRTQYVRANSEIAIAEIVGQSPGLWPSTGFRFNTDSLNSICRAPSSVN